MQVNDSIQPFPEDIGKTLDTFFRQTRVQQAKMMIANDPGALPQLKAIVEKYRGKEGVSEEDVELMNFIDGLTYEENVGEQSV